MSLTSVAAQKHLPLLLNTSKIQGGWWGVADLNTWQSTCWFIWGSFSEIRQQSLHPFLKKGVKQSVRGLRLLLNAAPVVFRKQVTLYRCGVKIASFDSPRTMKQWYYLIRASAYFTCFRKSLLLDWTVCPDGYFLRQVSSCYPIRMPPLHLSPFRLSNTLPLRAFMLQ